MAKKICEENDEENATKISANSTVANIVLFCKKKQSTEKFKNQRNDLYIFLLNSISSFQKN